MFTIDDLIDQLQSSIVKTSDPFAVLVLGLTEQLVQNVNATTDRDMLAELAEKHVANLLDLIQYR